MTRKFFLAVAWLTMTVSVSAQTTAEAIMALLPKLPTEAEMIRYQKETSAPQHLNISVTQPDLYNDFYDALKVANEKANTKMEKVGESVKAKTMNSKAAGTEYTVSQVQGMNQSQQEAMAQQALAKKLGSVGLSMSDLANLQNGEISEAQAQAMASKMVSQMTGGLTMQDIQAMEKMTDKQRAEYMQKSGKGQAVSAKIAKDKPNLDRQKQQYELSQKFLDCGKRELAFQNKMTNKYTEATKAGKELYNREYKARIDACEATMQQAIKEGAFSEKYSEADRPKVMAAGKKYNAANEQAWQIMCDFYARYIPMWRNTVLSCMNMCKSEYLSLMNETKAVTDELYSLTQDAGYANGDIYPPRAGLAYLEQPEKLEDYTRVLEEEE